LVLAVAVVLATKPVQADDAAGVAAAVGAGAQGDASYAAVELRFDARWRAVELGLAARGVWIDGVFRQRDWAGAVDAVTILRHFEASTEHLAIAAGGLAPSQIAHVADGYRAALDDQPRTGVRGAATGESTALGLEIDDVLDPALIGGGFGWQVTDAWGLRSAGAVDPTNSRGTTSAFELAIARRWDGERLRIETGGGGFVEPRLGLSAITFATLTMDRVGARWSATTELRAGTGSHGGMFGPLHRIERSSFRDHNGAAVAAGGSLGVASRIGWLSAGARTRGGLGGLVMASAGMPIVSWMQAAGWAAATRREAAGAAELRVVWSGRFHSALQLARMYTVDEMGPVPRWSATIWFGASTIQ
jgi:hypothetical protein